MTKNQLLDKLQSSEELVKIAYVPVSEVIKWINELESDEMEKSQQFISDLTESIVESLDNEGIDLIEDYDLELNYREVELERISFSRRKLEKLIGECIIGI